MTDELSSDERSEIRKAIFEGRKIQAIKRYRSASGKDLKESKEYIETLTEELKREQPSSFVTRQKVEGCSPTLLFWLAIAAAVIYFAVRSG